jgi:hypothetical protein
MADGNDVEFHVVRDANGHYRVLSNFGLTQLKDNGFPVKIYATFMNGAAVNE